MVNSRKPNPIQICCCILLITLTVIVVPQRLITVTIILSVNMKEFTFIVMLIGWFRLNKCREGFEILTKDG